MLHTSPQNTQKSTGHSHKGKVKVESMIDTTCTTVFMYPNISIDGCDRLGHLIQRPFELYSFWDAINLENNFIPGMVRELKPLTT